MAREAIQFSMDSTNAFHAAVDKVMASLWTEVEIIGLGEPLHGGEEFLLLRNRLFARLVEAHGFRAIAIESSFPRCRVVNEYVAGLGTESYEAVAESGFSHGFGALEANRELVEWMRVYNVRADRREQLRFYGFDSPTEMTHTDSPRVVLCFALDYLAAMDGRSGQLHRERIDPLLGQDADWENPAAMMDPAKSIGLSPAATALRIATEDFISELRVRRPELVAKSSQEAYLEAIHYAVVARQLLNYHAGVAGTSEHRLAELLGQRDAMMAENLTTLVSRERRRTPGGGKVLAFGHNSHLKRGTAEWQLGPQLLTWWPAGAQLREMLGARYVVIGSAVGVSEANDIGEPEAGSLEARLTTVPGPAKFIPTHQGKGLPGAEVTSLPTRSSSVKNSSYFPLTRQSVVDFDWLVAVDSVSYNRGGPPLP